MKKLYPLLSVLFLIYWGCEDNVEEDTTPPTVTITSPQTNSTVYEIVTITCMSSDNEGVEKVELWVNGVSTGLTDNTEPYSLEWNTTTVEDGNYSIIIRSYDTSGNTTDSDPLTLIIENLDLIPPIITIDSPQDGYTISDSVIILCTSTDNRMIDKVELWVDGQNTGIIDQTEPYSLEWNTTTIEDGNYLITVRSYDSSGNTSESESITLIVYKTVELFGELYSVTDTDTLYLYGEGEIPSSIGNLINLTHLYIGTGLSGEIPSSIFDLVNLVTLDINGQGLTGGIPSSIGNLINLEYFLLSNTLLTGPIPIEIGNLINLKTVQFHVNNLNGSIPSEIGNLSNLVHLQLVENGITGTIPPEIGNLTNLNQLGLQGTQLTGSIPSEIGNLINLTSLGLTNNQQLTGSIPSEIGNLTNLNNLYLYGNQLTGSIPSEIGNLTNLTGLYLYNNQLTGEIPPEIGDLTNLNILKLYDNQLTGSIPTEIGLINSLSELHINNNNLSGTIPESICSLDIPWSFNEFFNINNNQLCPPYPSCIEDYVGNQDTSDCD